MARTKIEDAKVIRLSELSGFDSWREQEESEDTTSPYAYALRYPSGSTHVAVKLGSDDRVVVTDHIDGSFSIHALHSDVALVITFDQLQQLQKQANYHVAKAKRQQVQ